MKTATYRRNLRSTATALLLAWATVAAFAQTVNLNDGWKFHLGDEPGAERAGFDDQGWRSVSIPHDWSIEDRPGQTHPFDKDSAGKYSEGYTVGGIGWYRRELILPEDLSGKTVLLRFEAVYMDSEVWVNGQSVARHPYGYTAFDVDISNQVKPGANSVALRINHQQPSSRWYSGSGIIRPVHIEILDQMHIEPTGIAISTPEVVESAAKVSVKTKVINARAGPVAATLVSKIMDRAGHEVQRNTMPMQLAANTQADFGQEMTLSGPKLWSLDSPHLYTLDQDIQIGGKVVDTRRTRFGVRSLSFDAEHGFLLNGKRVLLKGGNIHHDNYMLGAAGWPRADARKMEILKAAGYNAIRNAHNPASQATLDAADELGMLVINEAFDTWSSSKRKYDYARFFADNWRSDVQSWIASARNHPSVIMWSIGNEIRTQLSAIGRKESKDLGDFVRALDPTRPVTSSAMMFFGESVHEFIDTLDVAGYNYQPDRYGMDHGRFPKRVFYGSESFGPESFASWEATATMPWVIGDFVWAAFDYLGETAGGWIPGAPYPWHLAVLGEIDATGKLSPAAYYRQVLWQTGITPTSAFVEWPRMDGSLPDGDLRGKQSRNWAQPDLIQSWTGWPTLELLRVVVFSEDEEVELFLNGESLGRKSVSRATEYKTIFRTHFRPGELKVVGYVKGKPHSEWLMRTAGTPAKIRLTVDRPQIAADGDDLAYITAQLIDGKGEPVATAKEDVQLQFRVTGAGALAGVGNGDPKALESFQSGVRSTFWGRAVAVVRSGKTPGPITVEVNTVSLPAASVQITSQ
jgi:beta-galactosidase